MTADNHFLIKMLVASDLGRIQLLPALPSDWPSGRIEGVLCRGAIEIHRLQWNESQIEVTLSSSKLQTVVLELPTEISQLCITKGAAKASPSDRANQRTLTLPSGQSVAMLIKLK